ncbi:hypothetical protein G3A43_08885 [Paraburkholderia aspalathi]|nr:hypothetical protein [Paraburkholderia aspalathi]MBK3780373.1 hypothetical protein [Paraburkholderia aspalathi]
MGWKSLKDHYRITRHIVQVTSEGICIGSSFIHNLIVISASGEVVKRYDSRSNEDLLRYQAEMDADPEKLKQLVGAVDQFERSVVVFTYEGGSILEKHCESLGYPNATHDGELMYESEFSTDRQQVVLRAMRNAESGIRGYTHAINDAAAHLQALKKSREAQENALAQLQTDYPAVMPAFLGGNHG